MPAYPTFETDPFIFGTIVLSWPIILGFLGGWKAIFQEEKGTVEVKSEP